MEKKGKGDETPTRKTRGKGERIRGPERRVREVREEKVLLT